MQLLKVDPRALTPNTDRSRQTEASPQADALMLASIKTVGLIQPPVVVSNPTAGNSYVIDAGHRRVAQCIAAGLEEIDVLVVDAAEDKGAMRSMIENVAREPLNAVDQWRAIERLVSLGWTEEAVAGALALPVRHVRKLRLLANILPAMLEQMAKGDMPEERYLRTIAAAPLEEQREVWKVHKPKKGEKQVTWWTVANALTKKRMFARNASFGDDLAQAYGIEWVEDLFAPADQDSRYTTQVEAFLGAQQEWMAQHLPKRGIIAELSAHGQLELPKKAERIHGKPGKTDHTAMYLDREGKVQTVHYRMPEQKQDKGKAGSGADDNAMPVTSRPDVTRRGVEMVGDLRTDALHEALSRAPIEDDMLMALLVLAFAGQNVSVNSGASGAFGYMRRFGRHAAALFDQAGNLAFDRDTLRVAVRGVLIDVLSCRENATKSGILALVAGSTIGADGFLPNMGTEDFLSCLSRPALEAACKEASVLPRQRVKDTRAALVEHFSDARFVHASALFAPGAAALSGWLKDYSVAAANDDGTPADQDELDGDERIEPARDFDPEEGDLDDVDESFREAAE